MNRLAFPKVWRVICPWQNSFAWLLAIHLALLSVTYSSHSCKMYPMESESGNLERHALRPGVWQTKHLTKCLLPWNSAAILYYVLSTAVVWPKRERWVIMIERPRGLQAPKSLRKSLWTPYSWLYITFHWSTKSSLYLLTYLYIYINKKHE